MKLIEQSLLNKITQYKYLLKTHKLSLNTFMLRINNIIDTVNLTFPDINLDNLDDYSYIWSPNELINNIESTMGTKLTYDSNDDSENLESTLTFTKKGLSLIHNLLHSDIDYFYHDDEYDFAWDFRKLTLGDLNKPLAHLINTLKSKYNDEIHDVDMKVLLDASRQSVLSKQYSILKHYVHDRYDGEYLQRKSTKYLSTYLHHLALSHTQLVSLHDKLVNIKQYCNFIYIQNDWAKPHYININVYPYTKNGLAQLISVLITKLRC